MQGRCEAFAAVHESAIGPMRHLVRRSDLVAIGNSGHCAVIANQSLVTQGGHRPAALYVMSASRLSPSIVHSTGRLLISVSPANRELDRPTIPSSGRDRQVRGLGAIDSRQSVSRGATTTLYAPAATRRRVNSFSSLVASSSKPIQRNLWINLTSSFNARCSAMPSRCFF